MTARHHPATSQSRTLARMPLTHDHMTALADRLVRVPGVVGVMLGGSRGRGEATESSDTDLGLYYRGAIDTAALGTLAREIAGPEAQVTTHGGWGPWVDGGGWLRIDDHPVDLIYRDLDRVDACWRRAVVGEYAFHAQTGHPLGVPDFAYPAEVAFGRILADPAGDLSPRQQQFRTYPPALADAVVDGLSEPEFLLAGGVKVADRGDHAYLALLLSRALLLAAHAICARAGRWVTHEKGLIAVASAQPTAPAGFGAAVDTVFARLAHDPAAAVEQARAAVEQVREAVTA